MCLNQFEKSLILIHNHLDGITLSSNDMIMFLKHTPIKYAIVVGHNSSIYSIWTDNRKKHNFTENEWDLIAKSLEKINHDLIIKMIKYNDRSKIREIYENIMKELYLKYNINYVKVA